MPEAVRWILIDGRRWRATDPAIPPALRQELVDALMAGRRAVAAAKRSGDAELVAARATVHAAKVALGERGEPWWEEPSEAGIRGRAEAAIEALTAHRAPTGSICPSDVARVVGGTNWRTRMDVVREVAADLAERGSIVVTQRGEPVAGREWRGPVRLRRSAAPSAG